MKHDLNLASTIAKVTASIRLDESLSYLASFANFLPHGGPLAKATSPTSAKLIEHVLVL